MKAALSFFSIAVGAFLGAIELSAQVGACFEVELVGPWLSLDSAVAEPPTRRIPPNESGDSLNLTPPPLIRLAGESPPFPDDWSLLEVPATSLQTPHEYKIWRLVQDSLRITFSSGFSGMSGVLGRRGAGWQGKLRNFSDALPYPRWEREIELILVDCSSPVRYPASLDRTLPRSVVLTSGESIELGRPLPPTIATEARPSGARTVIGQTAGIFAEASPIIVLLNTAQLVSRIELHYAATFDLLALVQALEVQFGPAVNSVSMGSRWQNRTTTVYGFPSSAPTQPVRLILIDPRFGR